MDYKELIKKYWFLGIIGLALLVFIGMYSIQTYNNREIKVSNKQQDGKYVAYTIDSNPVFADDLYDELYENNGLSQSVIAFERAIFKQAYETTEEMRNQASIQASNVLSTYSQSYVEEAIRSMGYVNGVDDLIDYYVDSQKQELLLKEYVTAHQDEYLTDEVGTNGRLIYHILVKCETTPVTDDQGNVTSYEANPTEEQSEKLNTILEELAKEDAVFEYVAYQYSEDTSANQGGYIGMINEENKTMYDQMFADASMALNEGEVSDVVVSQFGYHIIKNAASTPEKILEDYYFISQLETNHPTLAIKAITDKADELGFEVVSETLKQEIQAQLESEAN